MYSLYLKYVKHKDVFEERRKAEGEGHPDELDSWNAWYTNFHRESPQFQVVFITIFGFSSTVFLSMFGNYVRFRRQGWLGNSTILEPMARPFLKSIISGITISLAAGIAFAKYSNSLKKQAQEES